MDAGRCAVLQPFVLFTLHTLAIRLPFVRLALVCGRLYFCYMCDYYF